MKKLILAFVIAGILAGSAFGAGLKIGALTKQNMSAEEFAEFIKSQERNFFGWKIMNTNHSFDDTFVYFDTLTAMIMALHAGKVDEIALPSPTAEYTANTNTGSEMCCALHARPTHLALGFRNDDTGLRLHQMVNEALASMKSDRKLSVLTAKYLGTPGKSLPAAETFEKFPGAETVKVAVTGDLPPLDMVAPDNTPVGFNTAVLAELGRRMGVNIELVNIESGARTSALISGRVDAVFWYQVWEGVNKQPDVPEGVLLSDSYYEWDTFLHLRHFVR